MQIQHHPSSFRHLMQHKYSHPPLLQLVHSFISIRPLSRSSHISQCIVPNRAMDPGKQGPIKFSTINSIGSTRDVMLGSNSSPTIDIHLWGMFNLNASLSRSWFIVVCRSVSISFSAEIAFRHLTQLHLMNEVLSIDWFTSLGDIFNLSLFSLETYVRFGCYYAIIIIRHSYKCTP